ncbi:MAG: hypothetical protein FWH31_05310 [Streptococcaceae bacterium]|nr:hypothetical protein [Streptococcaceae bacterium]
MIENIIKKNKRRKKLIFILVLLLLLVGLGFLGFNRLNKPTPILSGAFPDVSVAQKMSPEQLRKYEKEVIDASQVTINVYPKVKISSDGKTGEMWVQNLPTNVTGQEAILKDESGKILYQSGMIKPENEIRTVELAQKLSEGEHKGEIEIHFYDLKSKKEVGQTVVDVVISVT